MSQTDSSQINQGNIPTKVPSNSEDTKEPLRDVIQDVSKDLSARNLQNEKNGEDSKSKMDPAYKDIDIEDYEGHDEYIEIEEGGEIIGAEEGTEEDASVGMGSDSVSLNLLSSSHLEHRIHRTGIYRKKKG